MGSAGWAEIWRIATAMLTSQPPFIQILAVTLAALVVVMTLEGFRTSLLAIWRGHRKPTSLPAVTQSLAAPAMNVPFAPPPMRSFAVIKPAARAPKRKALTPNRKAFRTPRPVIRRHPPLSTSAFTELPHYLRSAPEAAE